MQCLEIPKQSYSSTTPIAKTSVIILGKLFSTYLNERVIISEFDNIKSIITKWRCSSLQISLTHFWQMFSFIPPENTRKPKVLIKRFASKVFWCFQGVWNGNIGQKWVKGLHKFRTHQAKIYILLSELWIIFQDKESSISN